LAERESKIQNSLGFSLFNPKSKIENPKCQGEGRAMRKTILVVDDTEWNRDLVVQLLEDDYTVLQAVDGEEAVRKTQEDKPDLILMDLGMPVMDGWEATRKIKANDALKHIPIIAVTSHAMVGDEIEARKAGCDDYLPKPIDENELLNKIKKFLT
jgi:two-component system, cell cycle response regulator DivK